MTVLLSFEEKKTVDVRACPKFGHCPFNIDAIKKKKSISRGISGAKQVIKLANTSNGGRVSLCSQKDTTKCTVRLSTSFT